MTEAETRIVALLEELVTLVRAANTPTTEDEPQCGHPEECVTDLSSMGSGPRWVCLPSKGGCGFSMGLSNPERHAMGLDPQH